MSKAQQLIAQLGAQGRVERRGEFVLDREKAREKLAQFQLSTPYAYVLELVQAAHLLGATSIQVRVDADEVELTFPCQPLIPSELEEVYSAVFERRADARRQAMRHLGLALGATQGLRRSRLWIESRGEGFDVTLVVYERHEELRQGSTLPQPGMMRFYAKARVGLEVAERFVNKLRGELAELALLRERCAYARIPIVLNGQDIAHGMRLDPSAEGVVSFATTHEHGLLGTCDLPSAVRQGSSGSAFEGPMSHVALMQHGVLIDQHIMPTTGVIVFAIVDSSRLNKNLSQSAFVQDEAWHDLFGVLSRVMYDSLGARVRARREALACGALSAGQVREVHRELLIALLEELERAHAKGAQGPPQLMSLLALLEDEPLLERADQADDPRSSSISASQLKRSPKLWVSSRRYPLSGVPDRSPLWFTHGQQHLVPTMARWLDRSVEDCTQALERRERRRLNELRWWQRERYGKLEQVFLAHQVQVGDFTLTWAWQAPNHQPRELLTLVKDGRLFQERVVTWSLPGVRLMIEGPIQEDELFESARLDLGYVELVWRAVEALPALLLALGQQALAALASRPHPWREGFDELARAAIEATLSPQLLQELLTALGLGGEPWEALNARYMRALREPLPEKATPRTHRIRQIKQGLEPEQAALLDRAIKRREERGGEPWWSAPDPAAPHRRELGQLSELLKTLGDLGRWPLFVDAAGPQQRLSLADAVEQLRVEQRLTYALREQWSVSHRRAMDLREDQRWPIYLLDARDYLVLSGVLGGRWMVSSLSALEGLMRRASFMARPVRPPKIEEHVLLRRPFRQGSARGEVGWGQPRVVISSDRPLTIEAGSGMVFRAAKPDTLELRLDHQGRALRVDSRPFVLGSVIAHVNDDTLPVNGAWDGVTDQSRYNRLVEHVQREACQGLLDWMKAHHEDAYQRELDERLFIWGRMIPCLHALTKLPSELGPALYSGMRALRIFEDASGQAWSLDALERHMGRVEFLHYVRAGASLMPSLLRWPDALALRVPSTTYADEIIALWDEIFLAYKLVDVSGTSERQRQIEAAERAYLAGRPVTLDSPGHDQAQWIWSRRAVTPTPEGQIATRVALVGPAPTLLTWRQAELRVIWRARQLEALTLSTPLGRFELLMEHERLQPSWDLRRVDSTAQRQSLAQEASNQAELTLVEWLDRLETYPLTAQLRVSLWSALLMYDEDAEGTLHQTLMATWPQVWPALQRALIFEDHQRRRLSWEALRAQVEGGARVGVWRLRDASDWPPAQLEGAAAQDPILVVETAPQESQLQALLQALLPGRPPYDARRVYLERQIKSARPQPSALDPVQVDPVQAEPGAPALRPLEPPPEADARRGSDPEQLKEQQLIKTLLGMFEAICVEAPRAIAVARQDEALVRLDARGGVTLGGAHPVVRQALERAEQDAVAVAWVVSAVLSRMSDAPWVLLTYEEQAAALMRLSAML